MRRVKIFGRPVPLLFVVLLATAATALAAYIIWSQQTQIEVQEPLKVTTSTPIGTLPTSMNVLPGMEFPCDFVVENKAPFEYKVTLAYSVEASDGVKYSITPKSGTSKTIPAEGTATFHVVIKIEKDSAPGTLTIHWKILRG